MRAVRAPRLCDRVGRQGLPRDFIADATGRFALAFSQGPTSIAPGDALVTLRPPGGDFGTPALLTSGRFLLGNVARAALHADGVLATWTEYANGEDRLLARWLPGGPAVTLDHAAGFDRTAPQIAPHTLQFTTQPTRRPDRRGRILVGLRCFSTDRSSCTSTLRLTGGAPRWTAARTPYAIGPNAVHRTRVTLTARARRALRRQGRITLTARGVPGRVVVVRRAPAHAGRREHAEQVAP